MFKLKVYAVALLALMLVAAMPAVAANAVPFLAQPLVPAAAAPGGAAFMLTVNGTGFVSGSTVKWNGAARTTTFVSASQLTAAITVGDIAIAGTASITVSSPAPGGGTSNVAMFAFAHSTNTVAFGSPSSVTVAGNPPYINGSGAITADLKGDGKADLIVPITSGPGSVAVSLGNGDGTFQAAVNYAYDPNSISNGGGAHGVAVGDFNGDGILDIVVTFTTLREQVYKDNVTSVLLGKGDGTFQPAVVSTQTWTQTSILSDPLVADVNGDGKLDLVGGGPTVLLGNGDGTFTFQSAQNLSQQALSFPTSATIGDFNGDGKLDYVETVYPNYVVLSLGNGDGTFQTPTIIFDSYTSSSGQGGVIAADLNGDGKLDVAYYHDECADRGAGVCAGQLDILLGNGDGTFEDPQALGGLTPLGQPRQIIAGDFNGDGKLDISFGDNLLLLGVNGTPLSYTLLPAPTGQIQNVAGDFNGDGRLDLMGVPVSNLLSSTLNVILQVAPNADFGVSANTSYQTIVAGATASYTVTVAPINGFNGVVTPSVSGLPAGASASFSPATITGAGSTVLTVTTTTSLATQSYTFNVTVTSGSLAHGGPLTLNLGPTGTDFTDFVGTVAKPYGCAMPGNSVGYSLGISPANGFTGTVTFTASGLPSGATASFSPATVTGGSGGTTLGVMVGTAVPVGTYPFTVTAASGSHTHSTTLALNVGPDGSNFGDFTGSLSPTALTVAAGGSATVTITLHALHGYVGDAGLGLAVIPPPLGIKVTGGTAMPVPGSQVITFATAPTTAAGTYTFVINAVGSNSFGTFVHSGTVTLTVTP